MFNFFKKKKIDLSSMDIVNAEQLVRSKCKSQKDLAKYLCEISKINFKKCPEKSISLMKESDLLSPDMSKKKWLSFRLFELCRYEESFETLNKVDFTYIKSASEKRAYQKIKNKEQIIIKNKLVSEKIERVFIDKDRFKQINIEKSLFTTSCEERNFNIFVFASGDFNKLYSNDGLLVLKEEDICNNHHFADILVFVISDDGKYYGWNKDIILDDTLNQKVARYINQFKAKGGKTIIYNPMHNNLCNSYYEFALNFDLSINFAEKINFYKLNNICIDYPLFGIDLFFFNPIGIRKKAHNSKILCMQTNDTFENILQNFDLLSSNILEQHSISFLSTNLEGKNLINFYRLCSAFAFLLNYKNDSIYSNIYSNFASKAQGLLSIQKYECNEFFPGQIFCYGDGSLDNLSSLNDLFYENQIFLVRNTISKFNFNSCIDKIYKYVHKDNSLIQKVKKILVVANKLTKKIKTMFSMQSYEHKELIQLNKLNSKLLESFDLFTFFDENSTYGVFYLEDMVNAFKYTNSSFVTKNAYFDGDKFIDGVEHEYVNHFDSLYRTVFLVRDCGNKKLKNLVSGFFTSKDNFGIGYSVDHFNYNIKSILEHKESIKYKISVIIPVYNNGEYLYHRAFFSLKRTKIFDKLQIIIVDDNSSDKFTKNIEKYLSSTYLNVKLLTLDKNSGSASIPRNKGMEVATGEYIIFLDPDDEIVSSNFSTLYEILDKKSSDILVFNGFLFSDVTKKVNYYQTVFSKTKNQYFPNGLLSIFSELEFRSFRLQSMILKKESVDLLGINQIAGAVGQDTLFSWQLLCSDLIVEFVDVELFVYFAKNKDSITNSISSEYFKKLLLLQPYKISWLKNSNLLDSYVHTNLKNYILKYVLPKLFCINDKNERIEAREIVQKIISVYLDECKYLKFDLDFFIQQQEKVVFRNNNIINVVYILDDDYLIPTVTSVFSLFENVNKENNYSIYLIANNLNNQSVDILNRLNRDNFTIKIIQTSLGELKNLHKQTKKSYCVATESALLKFKIAELIPEIDKVLYLDGDVIINDDLFPLYSENLSNFSLAAVEDSGTLYTKNQTVLSFKRYFNSGVMLLNLKKIRTDNGMQKLIELKKKDNNAQLMDQNIFNTVFENSVKYLPIIYNCLYVNLIRARNKYSINDLNDKYGTNFDNIQDLARKSVIIHYSSKDKPWKYNNTPLSNLWFSFYLKMCVNLGLEKQLERSYSPISKNDTFEDEKDRPNIVVSLTSFPKRIRTLHIVIEDILNQTMKADRIVLWLSKEQFTNEFDDLPNSLLNLQSKGLEIYFVEDDLKAHKKYFYAMQKYPNDIIVTIDDDLHYSRYLIERLMTSYRKYPYAISASRVHLMLSDKIKGKFMLKPYKEWKHEYDQWVLIPSMQLFPTCGAGTLFPPYSLRKETFEMSIIKENCLLADDIWLKVNLVLSNTPVVLADIRQKLRYVEGTQDVALWKTNVVEGENDVQIKKILTLFNEQSILKRIFQFAPYANKKQIEYENEFKKNLAKEEIFKLNIDIEQIKSLANFIKSFPQNISIIDIAKENILLKDENKRLQAFKESVSKESVSKADITKTKKVRKFNILRYFVKRKIK